MPAQSHTIGVIVKGLDSQPLNEATVTITLGSNSLDSQNTNSKGEAIFNMGDFDSWNVGDTISISAIKSGVGRKSSDLVINSSGGQTVTLTLEQTSDFTMGLYEETNTYPLNFAMLVDFQGNKITDVNPLPFKFVDANGVRIKATIQEENRLGSESTGADGATGRVLTLQNTSESGAPISVWVDGQLITLTDMTISHKSASSTITFDNIELFDSQAIKVLYYV